MAFFRNTLNCGVQELYGISLCEGDPIKMLASPFQYHKEIPKCGVVIFSEAGVGKYGKTLKKYIEENNLGTVYAHGDVHNPNHPERKSGIRVFLWNVERERFQKWVNENVKEGKK